jgi:predicted TPR repeat methyltransferase
LRLGQAYYDAGQLDAARQAFEQVLQLAPEDATALEYLERIQP